MAPIPCFVWATQVPLAAGARPGFETFTVESQEEERLGQKAIYHASYASSETVTGPIIESSRKINTAC